MSHCPVLGQWHATAPHASALMAHCRSPLLCLISITWPLPAHNSCTLMHWLTLSRSVSSPAPVCVRTFWLRQPWLFPLLLMAHVLPQGTSCCQTAYRLTALKSSARQRWRRHGQRVTGAHGTVSPSTGAMDCECGRWQGCQIWLGSNVWKFLTKMTGTQF